MRCVVFELKGSGSVGFKEFFLFWDLVWDPVRDPCGILVGSLWDPVWDPVTESPWGGGIFPQLHP